MSLHSCALSTCINKELKNKNKKLLKNWQKKKILNPVCNRNFSCAANQHGVLEEAGTVLECERVSGATSLISSSPIVKKKKHTKVLTGCQLSVPFFSLKKTYLEVFNNVTRLDSLAEKKRQVHPVQPIGKNWIKKNWIIVILGLYVLVSMHIFQLWSSMNAVLPSQKVWCSAGQPIRLLHSCLLKGSLHWGNNPPKPSTQKPHILENGCQYF